MPLSTATSPREPGASRPLGTASIAFLIAAYPLLFFLGYALKPWPAAPAALWPAYAIPFVAYLRLPPRHWPVVALISAGWEFAAFPVIDRFVTGVHPGIAAEAGLALANILTSILPAAVARGLGLGRVEAPSLANASPLWWVALPVAALPGALLGAYVHARFAFAPGTAQNVAIWCAAAMLGLITFTPIVYAAVTRQPSLRVTPARPWEFLAVAALTIALTAWLTLVRTPWSLPYPPQFLFAIPLVWLALRFSRVAVSYGVIIAALTVCASAAQDFGAFAGMSRPGAWTELVFPTQLFLVTACGGAHLINLLTLRQHALLGELGRTNERLHLYAHELDEAEDSARRAAASDLHDGVGQLLAGQSMLLGALKPMVEAPQAQTLLDDAIAASHEAQRGIRSMIQELSPPELEETTVEGILHGLARLFESRYRFKVSVQVASTGDVSEEVLRVTYRVVRELLFNAYKHSRTDRADVVVDQFRDHLDIAVVDHGVGFDAARPTSASGISFGLLHLFERLRAVGGTIDFDTAAGQGCRANVRLPLRPLGAESRGYAPGVAGSPGVSSR